MPEKGMQKFRGPTWMRSRAVQRQVFVRPVESCHSLSVRRVRMLSNPLMYRKTRHPPTRHGREADVMTASLAGEKH